MTKIAYGKKEVFIWASKDPEGEESITIVVGRMATGRNASRNI